MAYIGNAPVFPTQSVLPGNLTVTGNATVSGNATISGTTNSVGALTENSNAVRTVATSGAILQVVTATTSTLVTVSSSTYTDTTLSASITPISSSNKILILVEQQFRIIRDVVGQGMGIRLLRDSTVVWNPITNSNGPFTLYSNQSSSFYFYTTINYLDSPSTTSSVTYKTQGRPHVTSNNGKVQFNLNDTASNAISTIILMEVAA